MRIITITLLLISHTVFSQIIPGRVYSEFLVTDATSNLSLAANSFFGSSIANIDDFDGDGIEDFVIGASGFNNKGAVWLVLMNADFTLKNKYIIQDGLPLNDGDYFGASVTGIGDYDGDGVFDIAVGAPGDDTGGNDYGAMYLIYLKSNGTVKSYLKLSSATTGFVSGDFDTNINFGVSLAYLGDFNNDTYREIAVGAPGKDNFKGAVWILSLDNVGNIQTKYQINSAIVTALDEYDAFGSSLAPYGGSFPANGLSVGAPLNEDGSDKGTGAIYQISLNNDLTIYTYSKISAANALLTGELSDYDQFGNAVCLADDFDKNGFMDIVVGAYQADDQFNASGAIFVLFMGANGALNSVQKISNLQGDLVYSKPAQTQFGSALAPLTEMSGNGVPGIVAGMQNFSEALINQGAVSFLSLHVNSSCTNPTAGGTIAEDQIICYGTSPAAFSSMALPSGETGTLEYKWQLATSTPTITWADIPGTHTITYDHAGTLTQNTWFRRLARVTCLQDWVESNTIEVSLNPARIYVTHLGAGLEDGSSWANAMKGEDLQTAINTACEEVWVAAGTYKPTSGTDRTISFVMKNGLAIYGGFQGNEDPLTFVLTDRDFVANETILSGDIGTTGNNSDNSYHVVFNYDNGLNNTAILDGFTITDGNANATEGIHEDGAGMYNFSSSPKIANCSFSGNTANEGGGMFNSDYSSPSLINCTFSGNSTTLRGGGMFNYLESSPTLTNCSFSGNTADSYGGGIVNNKYCSPTITNCIFSGNTAGWGGGMFNAIFSSPSLTNCTFSGNSAVSSGGAIYNHNSRSPTLTNCIIWGNAASSSSASTSASVYNIENSTPVFSYSIIANSGGSVSWVSDIGTDDGSNIAADPLFVAPLTPGLNTGGDYRLQACSPAIIAGNNNAVPAGITTDLDGNPRFYNSGIVDMGTYEFQGEKSVNPTDGGEIAADQTICSGEAPDPLISISAPAGFIGDLEYQWQISTTSPTFVDIPGAISETYSHVGTITQTTWFRRLAKVSCLQDWVESNTIEVNLNPARIYVTHLGAGIEDGSSWSNAMKGEDMQTAINTACEEVWVAAGTYTPTTEVGGTGDRYKRFQLKEGVAIYGGFAGTEASIDQRVIKDNPTILSGDLLGNDDYNTKPWQNIDENCFHVVYLPSGLGLTNSAILDGFILQGGNAEASDKSTAYGGGLFCENNSPLIQNCSFRNNYGFYGGAGFVMDESHITFTNCLIIDNLAYSGAGFYVPDYTSSITLINTTLSNNTAVHRGGGLYSALSYVFINNSIIWANEAETGKQIYYSMPTKNGNSVNLNNTCISEAEGDVSVPEHLLKKNNCIDSDPLFVDPDNGDYRIFGTSPCVDAGNDSYNNLLTDIRGAGFERKIENSVGAASIDMGAYEYSSEYDPYSPCANPTDGGKIENDQFICYGESPEPFTSVLPPSGHTGDPEYQWQLNTVGSTASFDQWEIAGTVTTTASYDHAGALTQTTWFRRLARVTCDPIDWEEAAASNVVEVTVRVEFTPGEIASTGETICFGGQPVEIESTTPASGGDEVITYSWKSSADSYAAAISGATDATYTPGTLTQTTSYRRYAKDGTCIANPVESVGTWTVTVHEQLVLGCPGNFDVNTDAGFCTASVTFSATTGGTPTPDVTYKVDNEIITSPHNFPKGTTTVLVTAENICGLLTCSFTVTVTDSENPTIVSLPEDISQSNDAGDCGAVVTWTAPTSADNCENHGIQQIEGGANESYFTVGAHTITYQATDASGNKVSESFTITITDDEAPNITCPPDITISCEDSSHPDAVGTATATDNCDADPEITYNDEITPGACTNTYTITRSWKATDLYANFSTCMQTITIRDITNPIVITKNITAELDATGNATITDDAVDNGTTDNCPGTLTFSTNITTFTCTNLGDNEVVLTVTDACGNAASATATVKVVDIIKPEAKCESIEVFLDASGNVSITPEDIDDGSADNCGTITMTVSPATFTCDHVGVNQVVLTATDGSGNAASCTTTVTVTDNIKPTVLCKNITINLDESGNATITPDDINDGSTDNCGIATMTLNRTEFGCSDMGSATAVTLSVTDVNGNTASCTATVNVNELSVPLVRVNITATKAPNGQVKFTATQVNGGDNPTYIWYKIDSDGNESTLKVGPENYVISICKSGDEHWVELTSSIPCTAIATSNAMCTY